MKSSLFIVFLCIGLSYGFFGSIGQGIGNIGQITGEVDKIIETGVGEAGKVIDGATGEVEKVVGQILDIANGVQFAANFLWDSVFNPIIDMIFQGGQPFLDGQLNSVNSSMTLPANPLTDKYAELIARFKSNVRHLYEELFLMEQVALKAIQDGEMNFEERIRAFSEKINTIQSQIDEWAAILKFELEVYALTLVGDLENILDQYKQNIDSIVQSIENMFQQLTQNLMKNFLDFTQNVIPDAAKTIENLKEQGLLSFLSK